MKEEENITIHKEVSKKNPIFMKYFCERNIFHDCGLEKIDYQPMNGILDIFVNLDLFEEIESTKNTAQIRFSRILDIKFENYPWNLVNEKDLKKCSWKDFLIPKHIRKTSSFSYCIFDHSEHNDFAIKKIKKECFKATIIFDNWIHIVLTFIDLTIKLPEKINERKMFKIYDAYWRT